jgi:hypothetical protein
VARVANVKPAGLLKDPKITEALSWPGELVERHGWEYEAWSGADPVVVENIRFLAAYLGWNRFAADLLANCAS